MATRFLIAVVFAAATAHALRYDPKWSTALNASTDFKGYVPGEYAPGYAALVGGMYLTTDVKSRLYSIRKEDGAVQWTFNGWKEHGVTPVVAAQRQISGTDNNVFVLRGNGLYSFERTSGKLLFHQTLGALSAPSLATFGPDLLLSNGNVTIVLDAATGASKLNLTGTNSNQYRAQKNLLAVVQCTSKCAIVVYNHTGAGIQMALSISTDASAYVMAVNNEYLFYLTGDYSFATLYDFAKQANRFTLTAPPCGFEGYGITATQFMMHYDTFASAYSLETGKEIATTGAVQNLKRMAHIIGYENYIVLGCEMQDGSFNVSAWSVKTGGTLAWSLVPPSSGTNLYGNFARTLVIPAQGRFTLIDVHTGSYATVGPFPELSFASMVQTNTELFFAHNTTVSAVKY